MKYKTQLQNLSTDLYQKLLINLIKNIKINNLIQVGANDGKFSKLLSNSSIYTVSTDIDELAVEKNFIDALRDENDNLLSLHSLLT